MKSDLYGLYISTPRSLFAPCPRNRENQRRETSVSVLPVGEPLMPTYFPQGLTAISQHASQALILLIASATLHRNVAHRSATERRTPYHRRIVSILPCHVDASV